ncbi:hypothetical protein MDOR_09820 [Mycolicibacterium doricum]|uniref:HicB family protein n=1 Tax=Mycolicibacterium doricum TaxID=126673 RepID=A0A1X1TBT1_9MYCO|nr:hypothetical protein [Mycolicibacterium doricum]MCV7267476.1 hypothetical protein [Mycolicibacterium doricum]ORV41969.1 hypothetical protein AWC01_08715 [Mycolicibacterium doricum]BBZ06813.1 hypothetical protein MDOR_09820 [Mycolicibacterium doricum]
MNLRMKALEYSYRIHWSAGRHGYIATVAEFPALQSEPAQTPHAAVETVMASVIERLHALDVDGASMPLPGYGAAADPRSMLDA